jgi:hypothetical protein
MVMACLERVSAAWASFWTFLMRALVLAPNAGMALESRITAVIARAT